MAEEIDIEQLYRKAEDNRIIARDAEKEYFKMKEEYPIDIFSIFSGFFKLGKPSNQAIVMNSYKWYEICENKYREALIKYRDALKGDNGG